VLLSSARPGNSTEAGHDLYQRQIEGRDRQIDALVYDLYGSTDDEIAMIEGRK